MANLKKIFLVAVISLIILSIPALALEVIVWIEGNVGVGVVAPDELIVPLGGKNGTWVTVMNVGDIDDTIRIEGSLEPKNDWVKFSFKCAETIGQCDEVLSSDTHKVDNMRLTPDINQTQFYLEVYGYRKSSSMEPTSITMTAYSLTNYTKDSGLANIRIKVVDKGGGWGPAELPGMSLYGFLTLVAAAGIVFYKVI